jgi:hypothetical protein
MTTHAGLTVGTQVVIEKLVVDVESFVRGGALHETIVGLVGRK